MKLTSKEIFPVEARDILVENVGKINNGVCDMRAALEWAEAKCLELNGENKKLKCDLNELDEYYEGSI